MIRFNYKFNTRVRIEEQININSISHVCIELNSFLIYIYGQCVTHININISYDNFIHYFNHEIQCMPNIHVMTNSQLINKTISFFIEFKQF
jgi:hypothetical protein